MQTQGAKPSGSEYERLAQEEIAHYSKIFLHDSGEAGRSARETLLQPVPPSWLEMEKRAAQLICERTSGDLNKHVMRRLEPGAGVRMLSLGSGPGGIELAFAREARDAKITCIDLNPDLVQLGRERANKEGLNVTFEVADLNVIQLSPAEYHMVFCHASLHHVLELERLAEQIKHTLRDGGEMITVDVCTRNGYLMWPETRTVVRDLFKTLPTRFRVNHTAYSRPKVDEEIWEMDTSASSMECIRAEDIIPVLSTTFQVRHFVPYFSISRRLVDTMYGPNYDLAEPLDAAILNWIWQLDRHYLDTGRLHPETFFGIYGK